MGTTPKVYDAIARVMDAVSKEGIAKTNRNREQGYNFRGIDDVYNALSPILAANKLCILPEVLERTCDERKTSRGNPLFSVTVKTRFTVVSAEDGSQHQIITYGEAMDTADKATNKAMSAAYKYAAMQMFCIPTAGDNDADATTHDVAPRDAAPRQQRQAPPRQARPQQPAAADPDVAKLTEILMNAARMGTQAFNEAWAKNAGPARVAIFQDKELMAKFRAACADADEGDDAGGYHHQEQLDQQQQEAAEGGI